MGLRFYDAHNHLQDERLGSDREEILRASVGEGICRMVVNGACEADWPLVLGLARAHEVVIPSFGYHPWYIRERSRDWQENLKGFLDQCPSAIGEIGLDRWVKDHDTEDQAEVFRAQLWVAAERNLPVSIHCLQAWGKLVEILEAGPRPACGFLLHSFGGPAEMIPQLSQLGAFFSFPGYYAQDRKLRQRETFRQVPPDRLLVETDAPDQLLPPERTRYSLNDPATGKPVNHPANLRAVYEFLAGWIERPLEDLCAQVEENFFRLFKRWAAKK